MFGNLKKIYNKFHSNDNIRHLLLNYSGSTHAARHPHGPIGWVLRDEGQVDLHAGKTRLVMGISGELVTLSTFNHTIAERASFTVKGISNFRILGKHFTREIFEGQKLLATKSGTDLSSYSVIGPGTYVQNVDGSIGKIVASVPILQLFDERMLFDMDPEDAHLMPPSVEISKLVTQLIGKR